MWHYQVYNMAYTVLQDLFVFLCNYLTNILRENVNYIKDLTQKGGTQHYYSQQIK